MFEPHLSGFDHGPEGSNVFSSGSSLLDELDKVAPIQRFDAFPKVSSNASEGTAQSGDIA